MPDVLLSAVRIQIVEVKTDIICYPTPKSNTFFKMPNKVK